MRTEIRTVAETDRIVFGYWDTEKEIFVKLTEGLSEERTIEIAKIFGCNPVLVNALIFFATDISENVGKDLKDIWKRINK